MRSPRTLWRIAGDSVVLLPVIDDDESSPLVISGSAALLWHLLDRPISIGELSGRLAAAYGVESSLICADVSPLIERLCELRALELAR